MSSKSTVNPRAIQIIEPTDDHRFVLKIGALETILNAEGIRDRYVVVVSIAGALCQGKSFLLNFFLQYLNAQVSQHKKKMYKKTKICKNLIFFRKFNLKCWCTVQAKRCIAISG